jgi:hypothetical protein
MKDTHYSYVHGIQRDPVKRKVYCNANNCHTDCKLCRIVALCSVPNPIKKAERCSYRLTDYITILKINKLWYKACVLHDFVEKECDWQIRKVAGRGVGGGYMISAAYDWMKCSTERAAEGQQYRQPLQLLTIPYAGIPKAWKQNKRQLEETARMSNSDFRKMGLCPQERLFSRL